MQSGAEGLTLTPLTPLTARVNKAVSFAGAQILGLFTLFNINVPQNSQRIHRRVQAQWEEEGEGHGGVERGHTQPAVF